CFMTLPVYARASDSHDSRGFMLRQLRNTITAFAILAASAAVSQAASARLDYHADSAPEVFAAREVEASLRAARFSVTMRDGIDSFPFRDEALIYFDPFGGA